MKWSWSRFFIVLTILVLLAGVGLGIYAIYARMRANDYQFQVDAVLSACSVANNGELSPDPAISVVTSWNGQKWAVSPGNYQALSSYLRRDAAMPLFLRIKGDEVLTITCCNEAVFRVVPEDDSGDAILIEPTTGGSTYRMRARGGLLWKGLLECCTEGTYHDRNLRLE